MKLKNIILIGFILMFISISKIRAGSINIDATSTTVTVGTQITISVSANDVMGAFKLTSSKPNIIAGSGEDTIDSGDQFNKSYKVFTAIAEGTSEIVLSPRFEGALYLYTTEEKINYTKSIRITVVKNSTNSNTTIDVNKTYNKNNYLKSLSIDNYSLEPIFNKDTLEYNVNLDPGTESININASVEDKTASIKGTGEVNVSEGINTINVVVTAQNGNERTYIIKASVEEKDPVIVKVNGKKYRVVKKRELLANMDGYSETTVLINKFDIPALYNDVTKVTLVGLKDENGTIALFAYDSSKGEYKEYKEFTFDRMNLYIHKDSKSKYKETKIKINDKEVTVYKLDGVTDYYLLYATNTTTGNEGYYLYDVKENSVQRYNNAMLEKLTKEKDKYLSIVLVLSSVCFLSMLFLLIEVNRDNKRKNEE